MTGLVATYTQPVIPQPVIPTEIQGGGTNYKVRVTQLPVINAWLRTSELCH